MFLLSFLFVFVNAVSVLRREYPKLILIVDGGITDKNLPRVIEAGADVVISGSFLFQDKENIHKLRQIIENKL